MRYGKYEALVGPAGEEPSEVIEVREVGLDPARPACCNGTQREGPKAKLHAKTGVYHTSSRMTTIERITTGTNKFAGPAT